MTDLHGEALGEVVAAAARCLARADDRIDARPSERVARGLVQQRTPVGDPVRIVADAYQAAASGQGGGLGRIALAQARLSAKHHASSASTVHKLARKARAAGLLPEQAAGRPPVRR